jgi:hypothetical protein
VKAKAGLLPMRTREEGWMSGQVQYWGIIESKDRLDGNGGTLAPPSPLKSPICHTPMLL